MVIVQLTTDNREPHREYDKAQPWFGTAPEALFQGFAHFPEAKVHVVTCTQRPMASSPEKLADNIWFHSLHVPKLGWMRTAYQGCIRAVRRKVREINPDIVHGQGTERDCSISAIFSGFPNVLTLHGNMRLVAKLYGSGPFSYNSLAGRLEGFTIPRSAGVVCITRYTQEAVAALARRTWVLPNAVDASFFDVSPQPDPLVNILCVGAVTFRKNQNEFIRALDPLAARFPFKVTFLGIAPPEEAYSREFLEMIKTRPWCEHAGFAGRAALKEHLRRASLLVLPSLEDNCPMVVLEAMAASVPVIAPRVGGVPDLIDDGVTGLFCDPTQRSSMSGVVEQLLADPSLRVQLRERAKSAALQRFHPRIIAERHLEIYRDVLKTRA